MSFDWTSNPQLALKKKKGAAGTQQTTGGAPDPSMIPPTPSLSQPAATASGGLPPESVGMLPNPINPDIPDPGALNPATGQAIGSATAPPNPMVEAAPMDLSAIAPVAADPLARWQARNPATALSQVPLQTPLARAAAAAQSRVNRRNGQFNPRTPQQF